MKVRMNVGIHRDGISANFVIIKIAPPEDIDKTNNMYALYSYKVSVHGKYYSDYYRDKFQKRFKRRVF